MMRLGGILFISAEDPEAFAEAHVRQGYRAAYCPDIPLSDTARIQAFRAAFAKRDILLAETGAWCNMVTPDETERRQNIAKTCDKLALADELGALCCVNFIGSVAPGEYRKPVDLSEDAFALAVETVQTILNSVKPKRAKFSLEMMQTQFPNSVESYLRLIEAIDDERFAAHIDPVNIVLSLREYYDTAALIRDCFARLGRWIISCHAKDIILRPGLALHFDETRPGTGVLDYRTYLSCLKALGRDVPLMIEHLPNAEAFDEARDYVISVEEEMEE